MGRRGDGFADALAGGFFAALEIQLIERQRCKTRDQAKLVIFETRGRLPPQAGHSAFGYLSPAEHEPAQINRIT